MIWKTIQRKRQAAREALEKAAIDLARAYHAQETASNEYYEAKRAFGAATKAFEVETTKIEALTTARDVKRA